MAFVSAVFACYIPYEVFDAWWYLRFVLPAYPLLLALTASAIVRLLVRGRWQWQPVTPLSPSSCCCSYERAFNAMHSACGNSNGGSGSPASMSAQDCLPMPSCSRPRKTAASASMRVESPLRGGRFHPTDSMARWRSRAHNYRPHFLIETGEQQEFVDRFQRHSAVGGLGWPALADINHIAPLRS